jgi:hypothetical protein
MVDMDDIDPEKARAALEQLEAEKARRRQAKIDAGEMVSIQTVVVVAAADEDLEHATARAIAKHPAPDDGRPVHREFAYIITGVPRGDPDQAEPAPQVQTASSEEGPSHPSTEEPATSGPSCSRPTYVRVIIRNGNDDGDPGAIAEAYYTIEDGAVVLRDPDDKHITSRALLKGEDPAVLAKSLLREAEQPKGEFNRPIQYPKLGLA